MPEKKLAEIKGCVYGLDNKLQALLGYLELGELEKALAIAHDGMQLLAHIRQAVAVAINLKVQEHRKEP
jgi:hypothetical protein